MRPFLLTLFCSVAFAADAIYACDDSHEDVSCPEPNQAIVIPTGPNWLYVPVGVITDPGTLSSECDPGAQLGFTPLANGDVKVGARSNCGESVIMNCTIYSNDVVIGDVDIDCTEI